MSQNGPIVKMKNGVSGSSINRPTLLYLVVIKARDTYVVPLYGSVEEDYVVLIP